jgi:excinuclease UvrABC ATPase subunit
MGTADASSPSGSVAALTFFTGLPLTKKEAFIGERVVKEVVERLRFLVDVGLDYLSLDRHRWVIVRR